MEPTKKTNSLVIALIIVVILIIGAVYMWQQGAVSTVDQDAATETVSDQDANALNSLEQDLNNLDSSTGVDVEAVQ